jgi:hypothetical protein
MEESTSGYGRKEKRIFSEEFTNEREVITIYQCVPKTIYKKVLNHDVRPRKKYFGAV